MVLSETSKHNRLNAGKGMPTVLFSSSKTLTPSSFSSSYKPSPARTFSASMMEENIENAESIISRWDLNSSSYTKFTYLFNQNRKEAKDFLKSVKDLRRAMHFLVSQNSTSDKLVLAQNLMQIAMKRLEKEFYQILAANRDQLGPESVSSQSSDGSSSFDDEDGAISKQDAALARAGNSITEVERVSALAMSDLKAIAECMTSSGYGKECVQIYKSIRKSIVDEGLFLLGIEVLKSSQFHKMNWEVLEIMIKKWLNAVKIAVKTLFSGEKVLCDHVFSTSKTITESCFADISKEGAINLFRFPELVAKSKKAPERIFQLLDLHKELSDLWPEIESIFDFESTSGIKLQALSSLHKLGDSVRSILSDFESTIQKDSSKPPLPGGGIHPLTRSVMNYIASLSNYSEILSDIVADYPPFPESYFESQNSTERSTPAASLHLAWLILVLLCKLDRKAELYRDVSLSYLFLANNLQFITDKVRTTQLKDLLGEEWLSTHTKKVKQFALNYESLAWTKVLSSLPEKTSSVIPPEVVKDCFRRFNAAFEEAYTKQTSWVVGDRKLRDELKVSIARKLIPAYREFYETHSVTLTGEKNLQGLARIGPDDLGNFLSDLFTGTPTSASSSWSSSQSYSIGCLSR